MDMLTSTAIALDPALLLDELGFVAFDWQKSLLRSQSHQILLNCHRQAGKSTATSALAIGMALNAPGSLTLVVSASQRQANECFRKIATYYKILGRPAGLVEDSATTLATETGSRVVSLPDSIDTIVGYSAPKLIIVDEAARVSDSTYIGIRPMLLQSRGRLVAMSTPRGRIGWYHNAWHNPEEPWERIEFRASQNDRLDPAWLAGERIAMGPVWYQQEYECQFLANEFQTFTTESIERAFEDDTVEPLFEAVETIYG